MTPKTYLVKRSVEKDGLPEIGQNVFAHTVFQSEGKDAEDNIYGYMDGYGDLIQISHENGEDNYGWEFEDCVDYYFVELPLSTLLEELMPTGSFDKWIEEEGWYLTRPWGYQFFWNKKGTDLALSHDQLLREYIKDGLSK